MAIDMKWIHIMDDQPEHDSLIIQIHPIEADGHRTIGMRKYFGVNCWKDVIKYYDSANMPYPDFWWMYAEDFPFPEEFCKTCKNENVACVCLHDGKD